jgi:hypothetical protein
MVLRIDNFENLTVRGMSVDTDGLDSDSYKADGEEVKFGKVPDVGIGGQKGSSMKIEPLKVPQGLDRLDSSIRKELEKYLADYDGLRYKYLDLKERYLALKTLYDKEVEVNKRLAQENAVIKKESCWECFLRKIKGLFGLS